MRVLSIDPGITGALVAWEDGKETAVFKMPFVKIKVAGKKNLQKRLDLKALDKIFLEVSPHKVVIEKVHAMPGQGVTSMFNFGFSFGAVCTLAATYGDETVFVQPGAWKKHFGLLKTVKRAATDYAQAMTSTKMTSGIADAYLIGKFYYETLEKKDDN